MADYTESPELSKYNEAALQILRLNSNWVRAETFINKGEMTSWKFIQDSVWRELYADIFRKSNPDLILKKNKCLRLKIATAKNRQELYNALMARHEFLKKLQDDVGKGGSYSDGTEQDFE